jgi:hypothetical protein
LNDFLQIKEISYGEFPEIFGLNPRFKPKGRKVKVVLDIHISEDQKGKADLFSIYARLKKLLPSLEKHQCGEHLFEDLKTGKRSLHLNRTDKITDIAHMMEHVIIDLQSNITGMNSCSGITCGYKNPSYRFDIFVECADKKVGIFSVHFAADLLKKLMVNKTVSGRHRALIDLAKYLYGNRALQRFAQIESVTSRIGSEFGWKESFVLSLLRKLEDFGFGDIQRSLAT